MVHSELEREVLGDGGEEGEEGVVGGGGVGGGGELDLDRAGLGCVGIEFEDVGAVLGEGDGGLRELDIGELGERGLDLDGGVIIGGGPGGGGGVGGGEGPVVGALVEVAIRGERGAGLDEVDCERFLIGGGAFRAVLGDCRDLEVVQGVVGELVELEERIGGGGEECGGVGGGVSVDAVVMD